jgi:hypothetical protein
MTVKHGGLSHVLLVGFEGSALHTLQYFFQSYIGGSKYRIVDTPEHAEWVIFNADQPQPKALLQAYLEQKVCRPAIVISINNLDWNNTISLLKPFSVDDLEAAIKALFDLVRSTEKNSEKQNPIVDISSMESLLPEPEIIKAKPSDEANLQLVSKKRAMDENTPIDAKTLHPKVAPSTATPSTIIETNIETKKSDEKPNQDSSAALGFDSAAISAMATVFGHLPELDWTREADRRRLQINTEGMLLPWIKKAVEEGRKQDMSFSIDGLHLRLEYLPWTDCFVTNFSEEVLYTVMTSRFAIGELSIKQGNVLEEDLQNGLGFYDRVMAVEDLLWLAGLWTVHGRILPGDDPTKMRRLKHAPDCLKNIAIPEVHAAINLWQTRPMSAFQVISELNISQRYVFGVMAAATTAMQFEY